MRTLRITLTASLAGWLAGFLTGSLGGIVLALLEPHSKSALSALSVLEIVISEVRWALLAAFAMLPGSAFFVAPLVFRAVGKSSFWHPLPAACVGGGLGIVGMVFWWIILSLFTNPIHWSRKGEAVRMVPLYTGTFLAMGMATGYMATLAARWYARPALTSVAPGLPDQPPPVPYDY